MRKVPTNIYAVRFTGLRSAKLSSPYIVGLGDLIYLISSLLRRFEDDLILVLHPRSMLTKILDFVGLDWDEVVMDHENHMDKVGLSGAERSTDQVF